MPSRSGPLKTPAPLRSLCTRHRVGLALAAKDLGCQSRRSWTYHAVFIEKDVLGFKVPVQDEVAVDVWKRQDLHKEVVWASPPAESYSFWMKPARVPPAATGNSSRPRLLCA